MPSSERFAVHHLVVRQRQDEILGEGVEQPEGQLVVMIVAMDRILLHVVQRVVHPAHVPFVAEAEAAVDRRRGVTPGHAVDSSAIISAPGQRSRDHAALSSLQEVDRLEILAPP